MLLTSLLALDLLVGLFFGTLISVVNYGCLQWVIKKNADQPAQKSAIAVLNAQFVRYFVNIAALVAVYKHMWVLVGTAVGLTAMLKYTVIRQYMESRRHPYISRRLSKRKPRALGDSGGAGGPGRPERADQEETRE